MIMKKQKLVRVNTNITEDLNDWLNAESYKTGVSKSSMILMALTKYREQQKLMEMTPQLLDAVNQLKVMQQD
jgi:hypothetical protein